MTPRRPRVLFVSHDASRTGSPIVLLTLQRWLGANVEVDIQTLLLEGGPLEADFASVGSVHHLADIDGTGRASSVGSRLARRLGTVPEGIEDVARGLARMEWRFRAAISSRQHRGVERRFAELGPWDLVYLNSTASSRVLSLIPESTPVVTHIHEMLSQPNNLLWVRYKAALLAELARRSRFFIAVSEAARESLVDELGLTYDRVVLCREFTDASPVGYDAAEVARVRAELDLDGSRFVVGGSGTTEWRKGPDLFIQSAIAARRRGLDRAAFVWVGADRERLQTLEHIFDVERAGLADSVRFLEVQADPGPYFAMFDVFALTSRSDPFPLVCLEAAAAAKPIICFSGGGGMPEFVNDECGLVVPYADADAVADGVARLMADPDLTRRLGRRALEKAKAENDVAVVAPRIWQTMLAAMESSSQAGSRT